MNILVLATDYPRLDGYVASYFIHIRNKIYVDNGINVTVINFNCNKQYVIDGVEVITLDQYRANSNSETYDLLISHAPNIRSHYRFIKKYEKEFSDIIFFFHGHEVLKISDIYPKPYNYTSKKSKISILTRALYDEFKLCIWRKYFKKINNKVQYVFVSNWMYDMFMKYIKIDEEILKSRTHIIYNCIGEIFQNEKYDINKQKEYDFITIRNILDNSKYAIDIVTNIAQCNPEYRFAVIGKGDFYEYNDKPENLEFIERHLSHEGIIEYLDISRCALMPTRADAQGVMMCEMATYGIPLITSNIPVCQEVMKEFKNVEYIENNLEFVKIGKEFNKLVSHIISDENQKYFIKNTINREIELFKILRMEIK